MIDKRSLQQKIDELQSLLEHSDTAYEYEKSFDEKWTEIGREVFQQSLGEVSQDRNKKNDKH